MNKPRLQLMGLVALLATLLLAASGIGALDQAAATSVVSNGDYESGTRNWVARRVSFTAGSPAYAGTAAAQLKNTSTSVRGQLYQNDIAVQPNTTYQLSFWAKSPGGHDLQVQLVGDTSPFTNLGLNQSFNVTTEWKQFKTTFTTKPFASGTQGRLRFRLALGGRVQAQIDNVVLVAGSAPPPTAPTPTPRPPAGGTGDEMLVFDWNKEILTTHSGFAQDKPVKPAANGDMTRFVGGTLYFRARVRSIPVNQPGMKLGWCFWQKEPVYAEECSPNQPVPGVPGTDLQWQLKLSDLNRINNSPPIQWDKPRWKHGFVVRNAKGKPVSNKLDFNWSGENPNHWYPLDIHYTVVIVEPGGSFSGWQNYGW